MELEIESQSYDNSTNSSSPGTSPETKANGDSFMPPMQHHIDNGTTVLEAATVYLLMNKDVPISRTTRVQWLLDRLNTTITFHPDEYKSNDEKEFKILSILPTEPFHYHIESKQCYKYLISPNTKLKFIANSYRLVYCLDISPSQSAVDIQHGEILFDQVLTCFKCSLEGLSQPFMVPGCNERMQPTIYVTVIAHTPFFMSPAQQVLVKGVQVSPSNLKEVFYTVEQQLKILEEKMADVSRMTHEECHTVNGNTGGADMNVNTYEEEAGGGVGGLARVQEKCVTHVPMVSPDANFVNMLRYSMLALSLLPDNSLSNILVVTDGVVGLPDVNIMESLLNQLHYDSTAVSFIKVGSSFHPHVYAGYVPYTDILHFLSHSTMGVCLESCSEVTPQHSLQMNLYHKAYLCWTFHSASDESCGAPPDSGHWNTTNEYFHGRRVPLLLRKKQTEDKMNAPLLLLLSRRMREGYTITQIRLENGLFQIDLSLPWKNFIYLQYTVRTEWPNGQSDQQPIMHYAVHIAAPYEFLHDITCLMKKELKSAFRQAVIERFWLGLTQLASGDSAVSQHLSTFYTSGVWHTVPESVKSGMPVFMVSGSGTTASVPQFTAGDLTNPKFSAMWQPICQLENYQWNKWFHTHKVSLIVHHDEPLPKNLHLSNSSGRFQVVQCRQAAAILYAKLCEWASFVLIENHSYVKLLYTNNTEDDNAPAWFCIARVTSKLPCAVISIGFVNATPGHVRKAVCAQLRLDLTNLLYVSSPLKCKERPCCTILHKPLEKILIRYERVPNDFGTVVFPDGTQPPTAHHLQTQSTSLPGTSSSSVSGALSGTLFTTLSRYLYHRRWIWSLAYSSNAKLAITAVSRILSTLTKMRMKEGFAFAHSVSGIINMVLEVQMGPFLSDATQPHVDNMSCIIQYVLFPPHCTSSDHLSASDDDTDLDIESESELQIITEVWIEPQYGQVLDSTPARSYMNFEPYYTLADKIGLVDSKCISSLLTLEHLSLMCQTKSNHTENHKQCISVTVDTTPVSEKPQPQTPTEPKSVDAVFRGPPAPVMDERIHYAPFNFNLSTVLTVSQQSELLFSMFSGESLGHHSAPDKSNSVLLEMFHEHLKLLHDRELHISMQDSQQLLELLITRHHEADPGSTLHTCPISAWPYPSSDPCPQWRCFIKGVSVTHVILTFAPSSVTDIRKLCSQVKDATCLTLCIFVYDCPLVVLMNSHVNPGKNFVNIQLKDVCVDNRCKKRYTRIQDDRVNNGDTYAKQHCKALTHVHSKCFVMSVFKSLHWKVEVHQSDVQCAVDLCDQTTDEIDITEYLQVVCGHFKSNNSSQSDPCFQLKPLHNMIKEKFMKIIKTSFQPIPSNPEFYFCLRSISPDKMTTKDDDSDDEMSIPSEVAEFKSDKDNLSCCNEPSCTIHILSHSSTDMTEMEDKETSPLFLQLLCSVQTEEGIQRFHVPVQVLPTCLMQVMQDIDVTCSDMKITLDIVCLTLPGDVHAVANEPSYCRGLRTISFCSASPCPASSVSSDTSLISDDNCDPDATHGLIHLAAFQLRAITTFKEEVKWLLRDEMATLLLDLEPVTGDTLRKVMAHVESGAAMTGRCSCKRDVITLNFVYGSVHSHDKFIQELKKMPICTVNNVLYHLCEEDNLYYVAKDQTQPETEKELPSEVICEACVASSSDVSSISSIADMEGIEPVSNKVDEHFEWLSQLEKNRNLLPNFWLMMRVDQDAVTVYFHCRFLELETAKIYGYLSVHRSIISAVKDLCKKVNQSLLLQCLHDTRLCDKLLEPEDDKKEMWNSESAHTTPTITRNTSFVRLRSMDETLPESNSSDYNQAAYLEASLKFMPGFFHCDVVWQTHFSLHPRLKTGPGKSGLSRGIQALRTVLNKFSVSNRSNMFVYQDSRSNVFYLRLHENMVGCSKLIYGAHKSEEKSSSGDGALVSRSPSIVSLPVGQHKCALATGSRSDIRPRVRSLGEREREREKIDNPLEDTIVLKVHGITDVGQDIRCELVQVLQNRLDDAVLEVLSMMLARNAMCPLTPEDVSFLQREFSLPDNVVCLSIPDVGAGHSACFIRYLNQNLLQFLNLPKYTDPNRSKHFKDYCMPYHISKCVSEDDIFLYNQSQNPSSGSRGIACMAFATFNMDSSASSGDMQDDHYTALFTDKTYQQVVDSQLLMSGDSGSTITTIAPYLEFRIWKQGRVNSDALNAKLKLAVSHATWDLITELYLLRMPLCIEGDTTAPPRTCSVSTMRCLEHRSAKDRRRTSGASGGGSNTDTTLSTGVSETSDSDTPSITEFEGGRAGIVHNLYANELRPWFEFAVGLAVPSIRKCSVPFTHRATAEVCVRELQNMVSVLAPDTITRPFQPVATINVPEAYVPWDTCRIITRCLLIGRNFDQWQLFRMGDAGHMHDIQLLKHYQKFVPYTGPSDNAFVPRQRMFYATITSELITIYTYNWSRERTDKLASQVHNLSLWCSARISLLNSIISQKRGLFHNQLLTRKTTHLLNNPYLNQSTDNNEHLHKFPSTIISALTPAVPAVTPAAAPIPAAAPPATSPVAPPSSSARIVDVYRDSRGDQRSCHRKSDPVIVYSQEMSRLRQRIRQHSDEKKKMHSMYQARGVTIGVSYSAAMLERHARTIHYVHTPLLFLARWRLQSAATRDHSLGGSDTLKPAKNATAAWHDELCMVFIREYKSYLQTLGFVPLESDMTPGRTEVTPTTLYVQKPMLGGVMVFSIQLREPFLAVRLHALECCRVNQKTCKPSINQFTLSFLDECDRIKSLMHLHSFTYDFHLRCVHSYIANEPSTGKVRAEYHLTKFLDDFTKYYPKTPNFARNLVWTESMSVDGLLTRGRQLYTYLLSNNSHYGMDVLSMKREQPITERNASGSAEDDTEYVLVQVTNTPQVWYKDAQDRKQTDDFDVTLIISNPDLRMPSHTDSNVLYLKFYIILTSRREIYPKSDVEKTLGKFRTVSAGAKSYSNIDPIEEEQDKIKQESVNYLGYYSSHEQLMQQLIIERAAATRQQIKQMVAQGMVHCRTHLLWNKLVAPNIGDVTAHLTYSEFMELRGLAKLENLTDFHADLKILLDQPFTWYQSLMKVLLLKYNDQNRVYVSPDGNVQHVVILHPRHLGTFMMMSMDLHTSRGDLYTVSRMPPHLELDITDADRMDLINGFIHCIAAHIWTGLL